MAAARALMPNLKQKSSVGTKQPPCAGFRSRNLRLEEGRDYKHQTRSRQSWVQLQRKREKPQDGGSEWERPQGLKQGDKPGAWAMPQLLHQHSARSGVQSKHLSHFNLCACTAFRLQGRASSHAPKTGGGCSRLGLLRRLQGPLEGQLKWLACHSGMWQSHPNKATDPPQFSAVAANLKAFSLRSWRLCHFYDPPPQLLFFSDLAGLGQTKDGYNF